MTYLKTALTLGLIALITPACGGTDDDGTPSPGDNITAASLNGTWQVKEVADDNYPSSSDGLLCEYAESGTLTINNGSTGNLQLVYTTECTDDSQTELTYNWNVTVDETDEVGTFDLVLDGEEENLDLLCELDDLAEELDCQDEDGDAWRFER